jgi:hypothetical protein
MCLLWCRIFMSAANYWQIPIIMYVSDGTKQIQKQTALIKMAVSDFSRLCLKEHQTNDYSVKRLKTNFTNTLRHRANTGYCRKRRGNRPTKLLALLMMELWNFFCVSWRIVGSGAVRLTYRALFLLCSYKVRVPSLSAVRKNWFLLPSSQTLFLEMSVQGARTRRIKWHA